MSVSIRLSEGISKNARWIVIGMLFITVVFAYFGRSVEVCTNFADLFPQGHEYLNYYNKFKKDFGSANVIFVSLQVKEGTIFTHDIIKKIRYITNEIDLIPGVDHTNLNSLTHLSTRDIKISESGVIKAVPIIPRPIPTSPEGIEKLKFRIYDNPRLIGDLVSTDGKAALIRAVFIEKYLDYNVVFDKIMDLRKEIKSEDPNIEIYVAGDPMLRGWIFHYLEGVNFIFLITIVSMLFLLAFYFRKFYGVVIPLFVTVIATIWGVGFIGILDYSLDPLMLVIPFLISARAVSHGVQVMERFFEEYEVTKDKKESAKNTFSSLFLPGSISAISDGLGILVVATASFPLLVKLGIYGCLWAMAIIPVVIFLVPALLIILPSPKKSAHYAPRLVVKYLALICKIVIYKAWWVIGSTVVIIGISIYCITHMIVGTEKVGSDLLFPDSDYNISAKAINEKFAGINNFQVYLEGKEDYAILNNSIAVLNWVKKYRNYMLADSSVGGSRDLSNLISGLNRMYHYDEPKWQIVPNDPFYIANILFIYAASAAEPQILNPWMDEERQNVAITMFIKDLKSDTISRLINKSTEFIDKNPLPEGIEAKLAGGIVGLTAATNQEIKHSNFLGSILVFCIVFVLVLMAYRSVFAGLIMFSTIGVSMIITFAYMGLANIGLSINTLPVICVGVGIGVDYSVYIFDRIRYEFKGSFDEAIEKALKTSGMAVSFTATTLIVGVVFWKFISPLRFQADMSLLITLLMALSMITATILMPAIIKIVKPKFIGIEKDM